MNPLLAALSALRVTGAVLLHEVYRADCAIRVPDDMCAGGLMSRQTCGGSSWAFVLPKFTDVAL